MCDPGACLLTRLNLRKHMTFASSSLHNSCCCVSHALAVYVAAVHLWMCAGQLLVHGVCVPTAVATHPAAFRFPGAAFAATSGACMVSDVVAAPHVVGMPACVHPLPSLGNAHGVGSLPTPALRVAVVVQLLRWDVQSPGRFLLQQLGSLLSISLLASRAVSLGWAVAGCTQGVAVHGCWVLLCGGARRPDGKTAATPVSGYKHPHLSHPVCQSACVSA